MDGLLIGSACEYSKRLAIDTSWTDGFDSSPCSRHGFSKQQIVSDEFLIRSDGVFRTKHILALHQKFYCSDRLWVHDGPPSAVQGRMCLQKCIRGLLDLAPMDRHIDHAARTKIIMEYPSASEDIDPIILFMNMMVYVTVLYLYKIVESMSWESGGYEEIVLECQQRVLTATAHMTTLTRSLSQLSYLQGKCSLTYFPRIRLVEISSHKQPFFLLSILVLIPTLTMIRFGCKNSSIDQVSNTLNNRYTLFHPSFYPSAQDFFLATPTLMNPWAAHSGRYWMCSAN